MNGVDGALNASLEACTEVEVATCLCGLHPHFAKYYLREQAMEHLANPHWLYSQAVVKCH